MNSDGVKITEPITAAKITEQGQYTDAMIATLKKTAEAMIDDGVVVYIAVATTNMTVTDCVLPDYNGTITHLTEDGRQLVGVDVGAMTEQEKDKVLRLYMALKSLMKHYEQNKPTTLEILIDLYERCGMRTFSHDEGVPNNQLN